MKVNIKNKPSSHAKTIDVLTPIEHNAIISYLRSFYLDSHQRLRDVKKITTFTDVQLRVWREVDPMFFIFYKVVHVHLAGGIIDIVGLAKLRDGTLAIVGALCNSGVSLDTENEV